jgi:lipopolysaccharide/colanic/teichoic acid biosynthesis glycosyltransferase
MEAHRFTAESHPVELVHRAESRGAAAVRRCLDLSLATILLVLLAPLLLAIWVAIRVDSPGPAIYRQRRLGRNMGPFLVNKFRTMRPDADPAPHREYVQELISSSGGQARTGGRNLYKLAVDSRVTRMGRVLRRLSLDELPQLWNVVRGEMSLIGPRPVIPYEAEQYPSWYGERFAVKPGLSGLWQVSGRNEMTYEEMVRLDIEYVRRRDLWLDLVILVRTVWVVLRARGAA